MNDSAAVRLRYVLTRDRMTIFCVFQLVPLLFILLSSLSSHGRYMCTHVVDTSLHQAIDRSRRHFTLQFTHTCLTDPYLLYCGKLFGSGAQFSIW